MSEIWRSTEYSRWGSAVSLTPIDECPAGPWLDAVAAEAMGWKAKHRGDICDGTRFIKCGACGAYGHGNCYGDGRGAIQIICGEHISCCDEAQCPSYSTNVAAAWDSLRNSLIERPDVGVVQIYNDDGREYCAIERIDADEVGRFVIASDGELAATAITRAFCKFHGITEIKIPND